VSAVACDLAGAVMWHMTLRINPGPRSLARTGV